jgi:hypothetical protein
MIEKMLARFGKCDSNRTTPSQNLNTWTQAQAVSAPPTNIGALTPP